MRIGSLCTGYGGLDLAVEQITGATTAWVSDIDKGACRILEQRFDAPNIGDMTTVDWTTVEPIDILTAGFPCQPVSAAGRRRGHLDERWLWEDVSHAIGTLRPSLVVLENVRGLLTAGSGRLFGRVLGSLADIGYDAQWHGLRASDVGACHGRFRIFIAAYPRSETQRLGTGLRESVTRGQWGRRPDHDTLPSGLLPTQTRRDHKGRKRDDETCLTGALLPTPRATDGTVGSSDVTLTDATVRGVRAWGSYAAAIARHEAALGREAPPPTETGPKGKPRLSPRFVEWMMMLPAGWVTDCGLTRNEQLKALGNGVVPAQAIAALTHILTSEVAA